MNKSFEQKFWPFKRGQSAIIMVILLLILLLTAGLIKRFFCWPPDDSTNAILICILVVSLLPVLLATLDIVIERGGSIGYKDVKIDFAQIIERKSYEMIIPANIGMVGTPANESSIHEIVNALDGAKKSTIVIVDIENGTAWWETRLLVLLCGAIRLGTPDKIVFVGKVSGQDHSFIGWAYASDLFEILVKSKIIYSRSYHRAKAAAKQWEHVEPGLTQVPIGELAMRQQSIAFDFQTGLPSDFVQEKILLEVLGREVEEREYNGIALAITHGKLVDLFSEVLIKSHIDQSTMEDEQKRVFFENDLPFVALTNNGKYLRMVSRLSVMNEMLKSKSLRSDDKS